MNSSIIECFICLQPVCVPVKITAFSCQERLGKPSCHDIQRACLLCVRGYLQLDKPHAERSDRIKCPFCPSQSNPRCLNAKKAYKKDYLLMSLLTENVFCPNQTYGCAFYDTQTNMDKHLQTECVFRYTRCSCGKYIVVNNVNDHSRVCTDCRKCRVCKKYIHVQELESHFESVHHIKRCPFCHLTIALSAFQQHEHTCTERPVQCTYCNLYFYNKNFKDHMREECEKQERIVKSTIEKLHDEHTKLSQIMNDFIGIR